MKMKAENASLHKKKKKKMMMIGEKKHSLFLPGSQDHDMHSDNTMVYKHWVCPYFESLK